MVDIKKRIFLKKVLLTSPLLMSTNNIFSQNIASYKRIAVEETFTIPEIVDALRDYVSNNPDAEPGLSAPPYIVSETINTLYDLGKERISQMDKANIDLQVLSLWSPGVQIFEPTQAEELSILVNNHLAEAISNYPSRFAGLATIAPQNPKKAGEEIERAINSLNLNGVLINSHTKGEFLDDPKFWTIFEAAESLDIPIYLHPRIPPKSMYQPYSKYLMDRALWGYAAENSLHAVRLIMGGVFDQFPNLKIILGHMGEGIPFWLSRMDSVAKRPGVTKIRYLPSEYFKNNFFITTSAMFSDPILDFCLNVVGEERIMFAVDSPFASSEDATNWLDKANISDHEKQLIYNDNAVKIFNL